MASFLPWTTVAMLLVMASKSDAKVRVGAVWIAVTGGRVDGVRRSLQWRGTLRSGRRDPLLPRRRRRWHQAGSWGRRRIRADPGARSPATPPRDVWPALSRLVLRVVAAAPTNLVGCGVGCGGPIDPSARTVSPLYIPSWQPIPAGGRAGGARCNSRLGRHRRQGAGARRGVVRGSGRGQRLHRRGDGHRRRRRRGQRRQARCRAESATPATSATSSSSRTGGRASAVARLPGGVLQRSAIEARPAGRRSAPRRRSSSAPG